LARVLHQAARRVVRAGGPGPSGRQRPASAAAVRARGAGGMRRWLRAARGMARTLVQVLHARDSLALVGVQPDARGALPGTRPDRHAGPAVGSGGTLARLG